MAVGNYGSGFDQSGMADTWNGQQWTSQSFPVPVDSDGWQLFGVSCTSARFCEAVGGYADEDTGVNDTFAASWNGTAWSLQSTVNPDPNDFDSEQFNTVSMLFADILRRVGLRPRKIRGVTMAEQWNGGSWQLQNLPSSDSDATVNSVSCTSAKFCEAVGPPAGAYIWNG